MIEQARRRMMMVGKNRYVYVNYIESDGSAYTDLPIQTYKYFYIKIDVFIGNNSGGIFVIGARDSNGKGTTFGGGSASEWVRYDYNGVRQEDKSYLMSQKRVNVIINDGVAAIYEDGILRSSLNITSTTVIANKYRWYVFAINNAGSPIGFMKGKIHSLSIEVGNEAYNYKPAYDKETHQYGLYDELHDDFRTSLSTPFSGN